MSIAEKIITVSENTPKVYEAGKFAQQNDFWSKYISSMSSIGSYVYAFAGHGWTDATYSSLPNFIKRLNVNVSASMFLSSEVTDTLITIDVTDCTNSAYMFNGSAVATIPKLILSEKTKLENIFNGAYRIKNINFDGTVGQSINMRHSSRLSKESIKSLFSVLSDTASEQTVTLSQKAVNNAFETSSGIADGSTGTEWLELIETKSNWTVSLV